MLKRTPVLLFVMLVLVALTTTAFAEGRPLWSTSQVEGSTDR